ncbi:DUF1641 domain-containing protein [Brevibacillus dissolubilis]|uniref:DUF1641 domain-containing protein n=1 Tax=Brevibacillus dissolubilis TaxID=1844116 RepID=UPI001116CE53|nr:DUF1641 domain-containing protein [Brevibacillus dissolubilis]
MSKTAEQVLEVTTEQKTTREPLDVLDQLMKPEVQESLTILVENLPKLTEMVTVLTKTYDVANALVNDKVFIEDIKGGINEFVKPVEAKAKECIATAIEANDRATESNETIGLFGMIKMLKDPQVQKVLRFSQAFLEIMGERQARR